MTLWLSEPEQGEQEGKTMEIENDYFCPDCLTREDAQANNAYDVEGTLLRARDTVRVVACALEHFALRDEVQGMSDENGSFIFGVVNLLNYVADECDRGFRGEAAK